VNNFFADSKGSKTSKNKKKNRRKKEQKKNSTLTEASEVKKVTVNIMFFCSFFPCLVNKLNYMSYKF
jgi:hypothetical protein